MVHYCYQEKGTGALLLSGEGNRCSTVFGRKKQVHYCSQEKETGDLLFSRKGIWCSTVLTRKKLVHYCSEGEENWCTTVLRRRKHFLYSLQEKGTDLFDCFQEKESGSILFSGE